MTTNNLDNGTNSPEIDPWWSKYWYASAMTLAIWMLVAIYGAVTYDLELKNARVVVWDVPNPKGGSTPICQIELWLVVILVPLSLVIVNSILAFFDRKKS